MGEPFTWAEVDGSNQRTGTGGNMNHQTAGQVDDTGDIAAHVDPLGNGTTDQGRGDDGELALVHGGDVFGDTIDNGVINAAEKEIVRVPADKTAENAFAKGEGVADGYPQHTDDGQGDIAVHHGRQHVFGPYQATIKHGQAGNHQQHQSNRHHHPGGGAGIDGGLRCKAAGWGEQ